MRNIIILKDNSGSPLFVRRISDGAVVLNMSAYMEDTVPVPSGAHLCLFNSNVNFAACEESLAIPSVGTRVTGKFSGNPAGIETKDISTIFVQTFEDGLLFCEFYEVIG